MNKKLTICIPTYNRTKIVVQNIYKLEAYIDELGLFDNVSLVISDNGSTEKEDLIKAVQECKYSKMILQEKNIGASQNFMECIKYASTEWIMLLGDDDFIDINYLELVVRLINDDNSISVIIPNFYSIDEKGKPLNGKVQYRDEIQEDREYPIGSMELMFKAHQMSGLVFNKIGAIESYMSRCKANDYMQMYLVGYNLLRGTCIHITRFPLQNTVIKKKNFNYGIDYLLGEMIENITALDIEQDKKKELYKLLIDKEGIFPGGRLTSNMALKHPVKMINTILKYNFDYKTKFYTMVKFLKVYLTIPQRIIKKIRNK